MVKYRNKLYKKSICPWTSGTFHPNIFWNLRSLSQNRKLYGYPHKYFTGIGIWIDSWSNDDEIRKYSKGDFKQSLKDFSSK